MGLWASCAYCFKSSKVGAGNDFRDQLDTDEKTEKVHCPRLRSLLARSKIKPCHSPPWDPVMVPLALGRKLELKALHHPPLLTPQHTPLSSPSPSFGFGKLHLCRLTPTCLQVLGSHTISSAKLSRPSLYLSHRTLSNSVFRYPMQNLPACLPRVPILPSDCESPHQHLNQSWAHDRDSINTYI